MLSVITARNTEEEAYNGNGSMGDRYKTACEAMREVEYAYIRIWRIKDPYRR